MEVANPELWSDSSPYLYQLKNQIVIDSKVIDEEIIPVGIRQIEFNAKVGMLVNGKKNNHQRSLSA